MIERGKCERRSSDSIYRRLREWRTQTRGNAIGKRELGWRNDRSQGLAPKKPPIIQMRVAYRKGELVTSPAARHPHRRNGSFSPVSDHVASESSQTEKGTLLKLLRDAFWRPDRADWTESDSSSGPRKRPAAAETANHPTAQSDESSYKMAPDRQITPPSSPVQIGCQSTTDQRNPTPLTVTAARWNCRAKTQQMKK